MNDNFLTLDQYSHAKQTVESVFHVESRLPKQVFKRPFRFQLLCEFDFAMSDILETLHRMRSPLANESVLLTVLEPDPISFFYKRYQKIYAFYFKADISENEYYSIRWHEPKTPANYHKPIQFNTEIETYIPSSLSWAMWGQRSREIAVIGLDDSLLAKTLIADNGYWMDAATALCRFAKFPFIDRKVPDDFRRALIANYGSRADLEKKLGQKVEYSWEQEEPPPRAR
ncbi:MAG: hypothetical protein ACREDT_14560 [Methylocella sp.]